MKNGLEKLGLKPELLFDTESTVANLLTIPELKDLLTKEIRLSCPKCKDGNKTEMNFDEDFDEGKGQKDELKNELAALQSAADAMQSDNAHLEVVMATLQSQITSLTAQHTALQLANSQLVAEKEEVINYYHY